MKELEYLINNYQDISNISPGIIQLYQRLFDSSIKGYFVNSLLGLVYDQSCFHHWFYLLKLGVDRMCFNFI